MGGATVQNYMSGLIVRGFLATLGLIGLTTISLADEWTAVRLRGEVFVYRDGWVKLERGDVVADDSIIRTLGRGRVSFERGAETIDLLPDSQIRIIDQTGRKFTTVMNDYGGVEIDAEVQNVEHFSVATPFLAAVVKGTHFSVTSDGNGSEVSVERGRVFVEDSSSHDTVTIVAGQTASTSSSSSSGEALIVTGAPTGNTHAPAMTLPSRIGQSLTNAVAPLIATQTPQAPTPADPPDAPTPDNSDNPNVEGTNNGNHYGQVNENSGPGNNNGNHNGQDNGNGNNGNHNGQNDDEEDDKDKGKDK